MFTTAPFLRPLSGQAYKPADVTFPHALPGPANGAGGGDRADAVAGGQPRNQVVHDSLRLRTVDL